MPDSPRLSRSKVPGALHSRVLMLLAVRTLVEQIQALAAAVPVAAVLRVGLAEGVGAYRSPDLFRREAP